MIIFYSPDIKETLSLPEEESAHCCRVLRMKEGDQIRVVDGKGSAYECLIEEAHPKHVKVSIIGETAEPKSWPGCMTLVVAPTKNIGRIEWLLEKCVEIGLDRVVLVQCRRSERKNVNAERLEKILISAMKQSLKARLPELVAFPELKDYLQSRPQDGTQRFMGYCDEAYPKRPFVKECNPFDNVEVLIGPEGDFTPEEVELAVKAGFMPVTFGNTRLRTETAALYAVEAYHILYDIKTPDNNGN